MMPIIQTIKKRSDFLQISKNNISYCAKSTLILRKETPKKHQKEDQKTIRVGYTVTKKIGNAVVRNKCKRRYRQIFKSLAKDFAQENFDYVLIARKQILESDFSKIKSDVKFCLKGINKIAKQSKNEKEI